ncbi:FkbM family methyltransferase [Streptomyces botrytidirepellens]|uniref:FkbM family methyltransferase n=1 Tax=Streptomyces botrytidirepellens TaxID=2486417 RepID=A0A3M8WHV8_9ACTN|nr:FkbM family methyltransferase [Streptomyces botrytidirepellens]RNG28281.1 FkbM family methyltransferase [Streptomyces botrytidirepellens]
MQTLYRSLLNVLPRLGVQVLDLGSGTAVLSRRGKRKRVAVGREADLVTRGGGRYAVTRVRPDTWVVARGRGDPSGAWTNVRLGDTGAHLLYDAGSDERTLQLAAATYLCGHHVAGLLEKYQVNCVFDVGANAGQYGRRLRQLGYTGRIVSFEPTEEAFAKLEKAAKDDPEWWVFPFALGREEATQSMHVGWATMNSLLGASDYGKERYRRFAKDRTEEIEIRRLDSVMDKALAGLTDPRPYLKMDTQGYDLEVFAGAGDRIEEFVGLQSEVAVLRLYEGSPAMSEAIAAYEDSGFGITGMYPVTREDTTGRVVEFDCVMMRADAAPK